MTDSDSDLSEIFDKFRNSPLAAHAQAIGYLCIIWGWLELSVNTFLCTLTGMDTDDAAAALVYNMDFRNKLKALLTLGFVRKPSDEKPSNEWYSNLESVVNEIDNDLRPERNRMVHDSWHPGEDDVLRITHNAKVAREQAFKMSLQFGTGKLVSAPEIYALSIRILAAQGKLLTYLGEYDSAQQSLPEKPA
jgi:hypothetical protein